MLEGYCTTWESVGGKKFGPGPPLSVKPGDRLRLHISSDVPYELSFLRLRLGVRVHVDRDNPRQWTFTEEPDFEAVSGFDLVGGGSVGAAVTQPLPPEPWNGCGWTGVDFELRGEGLRSGMYAAYCRARQGNEDLYIVFVVKPFLAPAPRWPRLAVLASTNTWNAYNDFPGGERAMSNYTQPPGMQETGTLSFERPNHSTRPVPPFADADHEGRHLTRGELWVLTWLEDNHYPYDLFAESDLHLRRLDLDGYAGLVLNTHPEYWTLNMRDQLERYVGRGGRLLYLGGNGLYEQVAFDSDVRTMMLVRQGDFPNRWLFRCVGTGLPELRLLGVAYDPLHYQGRDAAHTEWKDVGPYFVRAPGHRFFRGKLAYGATMGEHGLSGARGTGEDGRACGWEMDHSELQSDPGHDGPCDSLLGGKPPGHVVLAESQDRACQMTYHPTGPEDARGFVLAVGSLCFGGSLVVDRDLQMVVSTALDECLGVVRGPWNKQYAIARRGSARSDSPLVVLNRRPEQHDVFWIGANGDVSSTWWNERLDNGTWHAQFGIALHGSVRAGSPLVALNRRPEQHDVFWIGENSDVSSTWRSDDADDGAWHAQFGIAGPGSVREDSPLVVLNRRPEQHDVFWIGANGDVSSTWRSDGVDSGAWHAQFAIALPGSVRASSPLVALNRRPEQHDVFWIGANGDVSSTWRSDGVDSGAWHAQFAIALPGSVRASSPLVVLNRRPEQHDVFWIGANGDVSSTWRSDGVDSGAWHAQFAIAGPGSVREDSPLVALNRRPEQHDVFWIGANGDVSSTWRSDGVDSGAWHAQFAIALPGSVRASSPLVVLNRRPEQHDVFWIGANGDVSSTWRSDGVDNGAWHAQFAIAGPGSVREDSPLMVLNRRPEQHDVFWIGANGDVSWTWRSDNVDGGAWHPQAGIALPGSVRQGSPLVVRLRTPDHLDVFWIGANGDVSSTYWNPGAL